MYRKISSHPFAFASLSVVVLLVTQASLSPTTVGAQTHRVTAQVQASSSGDSESSVIAVSLRATRAGQRGDCPRTRLQLITQPSGGAETVTDLGQAEGDCSVTNEAYENEMASANCYCAGVGTRLQVMFTAGRLEVRRSFEEEGSDESDYESLHSRQLPPGTQVTPLGSANATPLTGSETVLYEENSWRCTGTAAGSGASVECRTGDDPASATVTVDCSQPRSRMSTMTLTSRGQRVATITVACQ